VVDAHAGGGVQDLVGGARAVVGGQVVADLVDAGGGCRCQGGEDQEGRGAGHRGGGRAGARASGVARARRGAGEGRGGRGGGRARGAAG
jgi:hypothetical protein